MPPTETIPPRSDAAAQLCSDVDQALDDDPRGTAAEFGRFLLIEHRASFGRDAADDALRAVYGPDAPAVAALDGLRPFAVRPIGRTDDTVSRVRWVGRSGPDASLLPVDTTPTPSRLTALTTDPATTFEPLFAVCTNGSRDRCCAVKGRDLAARMHHVLDDPDDPATVVEISHLGGHRYAPTMLVLPWGYAYAWLDEDTALDVAHAARDGLVHPRGLRGRADLSPVAQAAEAIWRTDLGQAPVDAVTVDTVASRGDRYMVTGRVQGDLTTLTLRRQAGPTIAATVCGGKPIPTGRWIRL